jgi:hypothetical protein
MAKLILTTSGYDFIIYDISTKQISFKSPKSEFLNCPELEGQGRDTHRPFGIEVCKKFIYIASNSRLAKFKKNNFEFDSLIEVPLFINTHQILKDKDKLYVTNTSINTIGIYDSANSEYLNLNVENFQLQSDVKKPKDANELDLNHVNSLYEYNGRIYFCLHNKHITDTYYGFLNKETYKVTYIIELGKEGHNIRILNNVMYTLSTGTGELFEIDLLKKTLSIYKLVDEAQVFLRGLEIYKGSLIIGCSNNFKTGLNKEAYLLEIKLDNKANRKKINLPGIPYINDMKLLA